MSIHWINKQGVVIQGRTALSKLFWYMEILFLYDFRKRDFHTCALCVCVCSRNWHWDEPSCGYEVCVVMYHQPSAPPGIGGLYMFQWNDDNCETKNNFICKYTAGIAVMQCCDIIQKYYKNIQIWHEIFSPQRNLRTPPLLLTPIKQVHHIWHDC